MKDNRKTLVIFTALLAINCVTISALTPEEEAQAIQKFHEAIFSPLKEGEEYPITCQRIESALDQLPEITSKNPYIMERRAQDGSVRFFNILAIPIPYNSNLLKKMLAKLATPRLKAIAIHTHLIREGSAYDLAQDPNLYPNHARRILGDFMHEYNANNQATNGTCTFTITVNANTGRSYDMLRRLANVDGLYGTGVVTYSITE